jgi:photosystem II stability/assembly factor-like uncharacterized protein
VKPPFRTVSRVAGLVLICAALLASSGASLAATPGVWTDNGPYGGVVSGFAFDPSSPSTVYAATRNGIFKSTDSGANWSAASTGLTTLWVNAVAVDPANGAVIYAATNNQLFRSSNGGASWASVSVPGQAGFSSVAFGPGTSPIVYVASSSGVDQSTDGSTWTPVAVPGGQPYAVVTDPSNALHLFVVLASGALERTTDGGATWSGTSLGNFSVVSSLVIDPSNDSNVYAAAGGTVQKSTDGGATFAPSSTGLTGTADVLAIAPSSPSRIYSAGRSGSLAYLARTDNAAGSWSTIASTPGATLIPKLGVDPSTSGHVLVGTYAHGVYVTTTAGASWSASNNGLTAASPDAVAVDPTSTTVAFAGMGLDGIYRTADGGTSWQSVTAGLVDPTHPQAEVRVSSVTVSAGTPSSAYVVRRIESPGPDTAAVMKSTDGGTTWASADTGLPTDVQRVYSVPGSSTMLFATAATDAGVTPAGQVYETTDAGAHWTPVGPSTGPVAAFALFPASHAVAVAIGLDDEVADEALYVSTNWGSTWTKKNYPAHPVDALTFGTTGTTLYAGSVNDSTIAKSTNTGGSWTTLHVDQSNAASEIDAIALDPLVPTTLYAGTDSGGLWYSTNSGTSWAQWTPGIFGSRVASLAFTTPGTTDEPLLSATSGVSRSGVWTLTPAPHVRTKPSLSGTARVGSTLTCNQGTWTRAASYTYAWLLNGTAVKGATSQTFILPSTAVGKQVACRVTAKGPGGTATAKTPAELVAS